jgi:hypothetical protein
MRKNNFREKDILYRKHLTVQNERKNRGKN